LTSTTSTTSMSIRARSRLANPTLITTGMKPCSTPMPISQTHTIAIGTESRRLKGRRAFRISRQGATHGALLAVLGVMRLLGGFLEATGKVNEMLRRTVVTATIMLLVASCGSSSSQPSYDEAIQEGQSAAQELLEQGASAVAIALVSSDRIIWSQAFGL